MESELVTTPKLPPPPRSAQRWLAAFVHYYNTQRPKQALENRTPVKEVMNR
jgi:transposase InsO family protein